MIPISLIWNAIWLTGLIVKGGLMIQLLLDNSVMGVVAMLLTVGLAAVYANR